MNPPATSRRDVGDVMTIGLATTVAMWGLGYVLRLPGSAVPARLLLGVLVACLLAGGFGAGRWTGRGWRGGAYAGLASGLLNLLVLGGLLSSGAAGRVVPPALWWIPGSLLASSLLGTIGALLARLTPAPRASARNWPAAFATVAACATLLLLSAGGAVTGAEAGLAVPDWPNSYGYNMFLYPWSRMTGGIYFEHAHRLLGSLVGLTTILLALYLQLREQRRWVRALAWLALAAVIAQGILGGLRVTGRFTASASAEQMSPRISLAIVHGVVAQVFFGMLVGLRVFLDGTWRSGRARRPAAGAATDRLLGTVLLGLLLVQLVLGALQRHISSGLLMHIGMAVLVTLAGLAAGLRAWGFYGDQPVLPRLGAALLLLIGLQLALGLGALVATGIALPHRPPTALQVLITTAHQTGGALLLGCAVMLLLWNYRLLKPAAPRGPAGQTPSSDGPSG